MKEKMRNSGINIIGKVPWGTHLCQFYHTKEDLLEILVPYFMAGLENNEFCMWIASEPLNQKETEEALRKAVPDFDLYLNKGQIEIVPHAQWYLKDGNFDLQRVLDAWVYKLNQALSKGFDGIRVTGNTAWVEKRGWKDFGAYEEEVNNVIGKYKMIAICTYSLEKCGVTEVLDVVQNHEFALIRREAEWELIESFDRKQIGLLQKAYDELEIRIKERTAELIRANTDLRGEIAERKKTEKALKQSERDYRGLFESAHDAIIIFNPEGEIILDANQRACDIYGFDRSEFIGISLQKISEDVPRGEKHIRTTLEEGFYHHFETIQYRKDGSEMYLEINASVVDYKGQRAILSINRDITDRKKTEEALKEKEERYRELFDNMSSGVSVYEAKDKGNDFMFKDFNRAGERIEKAKKEELIGKTIHQVFSGVKDFPLFEIFQRVWKTAKPEHFSSAVYQNNKPVSWRENYVYKLPAGEIVSIFDDITERKQADVALQTSEQRYKLLFERNLAAVYRTTLDGNLLDCNESFAQLLGYDSPEEIQACNASKFYFDNKIRRDFLALLKDQGSLSNFEICLRRKDGAPVWILENVILIKEDGSSSPVIQGTSIDITERRKAEKALQESEEKYRNLVENSKDSIVLIDSKGKILFGNKASEELTGYTVKEGIGMNVKDITPAKYWPRSLAALLKARSGEPVPYFDSAIRRKDGKLVLVETGGQAIFKEGKPVGVQIITRDITERKKAEQALRESEEKYRSLFEGSLHPITIYDRNATIVMLNKVGAENLKKPLTEILGKPLGEFIPETSELTVKRVRKVLETGKPLFVEDEISLPQGKRWFLSTLHPVLNPRGQPDLVQVISYDITERKKAEELLRESEERFRIASQISSDVVYERDLQTGIATFYGDIDSHLGYEPGGYPRTMEGWRRHVHPEDLAWINNKSVDQLEPGIPHSIEYRMRKKDGTYMIWSDRIMIIRDEKTSKPLKFIGTASDITERKKVEELIRTSEAQLSNAMKIAKLGYWEYDVADDLFTFNDHFYAIFRTTAEQVGGYKMSPARYAQLFLHPDDRAVVAIEIKKALETTDPHFSHQLEHRIIYADGDIGHISVRYFIVKDNQGRTVKTYGANQDITERKKAEEALRKAHDELEKRVQERTAELSRTNVILQEEIAERKQAEEALRESELWMRNIFNSLEEGVLVVTPDRILVNINLAAHRMFGYSKEELTDLSTEVLHVDHEHYVEFGRRIKKAFDEDETANFEFNAKRKNGEIFPTEHTVSLLKNDDGEALGIVSVVRDITQRKQAEEALLRAHDELEERVKERTAELSRTNQLLKEEITERKKTEQALKESKELFLSFMDQFPGVAFIKDEKSRLQYANPYMKEILGADKWIGLVATDHYPREIAEKLLADDRKALKEGPLVIEDSVPDKQGTKRLFQTYKFPIRQEGKPALLGGIAIDITERKKAEEALRDSEKKYRNLVEDSLDGICVVQGLEIKFVNKSLLKMFGYQSEDEMVGQKFTKFVLPKYSRKMEEMGYAREKGENVPQHYEFKALRKDGIEFDADLSVSRIPYQGSVARQGIIRDITQRKRAEDVLRNYQFMVESANDVIFFKDLESRYVIANARTIEAFGLTREEVIGKNDLEIMSNKEEAKENIEDDQTVLKTGKPKEIFKQMTGSGGKEYWFHAIKVPQHNNKGDIIGLVGIARDITERKLAEEEIRRLSQYLESIIDNANVWLDVLDEKANVVIWNKAAEEISGYSREEVIGHGKIWEWLYPDEKYRNEITAKAAAIIEKGEVVEDFETIIRCKNGEIKTISWNSRNLIGTDGKPMGSIALGRDTTERKKLMQQLIQSEKLAAVGTLAYGIAHEFNNILAGMLSSAEFGASTSDPELIKESFDLIAENTERASSITSNLLSFARQRDAKKEITNITQSLKGVLALTRRELEKANIKIVEEFRSIPEIFCDPGQFSEVFLNLITNARDAMTPEGGTLTIKVDSQKDNIRIIVKDTGCGIPEEIKQRIFDPFVTTKGALGKSDIPGTGLGLFLTYGIIDSYQGKIDVESGVGKGTQFTILIPISKNLPPADFVKKEIESPEEIQRQLNILLVDDEVVLCKILKKFLETKGHQVTASSKAREGLRLHHKDKYDVIISDITMPDMDGIELIKKIKEKDKKTRIIVMTGHVLRSKEKEARDAGADEVLIKPFENNLLYQTISRLITE